MYLSKFKSDPNAFLFILKYPIGNNQNKKSAKSLLIEPNYAIYCDQHIGPLFGKSNLIYFKNSQLTELDFEDIEIFRKTA